MLDALERPLPLRRAYYWVDFTVRHPINTGVQRVTRLLARALEELGVELDYVVWDYKARRFTSLDVDQRRHLAEWNGPTQRSSRQLPQPRFGDWLIIPET